ncbi:hypothetical protein ES702_02985 [subsurface metagenome]
MNRVNKTIYFIGLTCTEMSIFGLIVMICEQFELLDIISIGSRLANLTMLDTWLIVIFFVFFPLFSIINLILLKLGVLKIE